MSSPRSKERKAIAKPTEESTAITEPMEESKATTKPTEERKTELKPSESYKIFSDTPITFAFLSPEESVCSIDRDPRTGRYLILSTRHGDRPEDHFRKLIIWDPKLSKILFQRTMYEDHFWDPGLQRNVKVQVEHKSIIREPFSGKIHEKSTKPKAHEDFRPLSACFLPFENSILVKSTSRTAHVLDIHLSEFKEQHTLNGYFTVVKKNNDVRLVRHYCRGGTCWDDYESIYLEKVTPAGISESKSIPKEKLWPSEQEAKEARKEKLWLSEQEAEKKQDQYYTVEEVYTLSENDDHVALYFSNINRSGENFIRICQVDFDNNTLISKDFLPAKCAVGDDYLLTDRELSVRDRMFSLPGGRLAHYALLSKKEQAARTTPEKVRIRIFENNGDKWQAKQPDIFINTLLCSSGPREEITFPFINKYNKETQHFDLINWLEESPIIRGRDNIIHTYSLRPNYVFYVQVPEQQHQYIAYQMASSTQLQEAEIMLQQVHALTPLPKELSAIVAGYYLDFSFFRPPRITTEPKPIAPTPSTAPAKR